MLKRCGCKRPDRCPHGWTVRYRDETGRQREKTFPAALKRSAQEFAARTEHQKVTGAGVLNYRAGERKIQDVLPEWIATRRTRGTRDAYRSIAQGYVYPAIGMRPVAGVRKAEIARIISDMQEKGLSDSYQNSALQLMRGFWHQMVEDRVVAENPVPRGVVGNRVSQQLELPDPSVFISIADALPPEWRLTVPLMVGCGLRMGEALAIHESCVVDGGLLLRIDEQVSSADTTDTVPLKHRRIGEYREVPIPAKVLEAITQHTERYGSEGYLLRGKRSRFVSRSTYRYHWMREAEKNGHPDVTPHACRHWFASSLLSRGVPISDVSKYLGHADINTTYKIYGHLLPESYSRAREAMGQALIDDLPTL